MEARIIVICLTLAICTGHYGCYAETYNSGVVDLNINGSNVSLSVQGPSGKTWNGNLGLTLPSNVTSGKCEMTNNIHQDDACVQFSNGWTLTANRHSTENCTVLSWTSTALSDVLEDCFDLGTDHWYGGGEKFYQLWTVETEDQQETPCVTGDNGINFGGVMERYWVSSSGYAVSGNNDLPMFYRLSKAEKRFCLKSQNKSPYYLTNPLNYINLTYVVCSGENVKDTHTRWVSSNDLKPTSIPDERMIVSPIWSTWAIYKAKIDEQKVLDFANQILDHNFTNSQLEIDDNWETCYGEQKFNDNFPDPKGLVKKLNDLGFRTTLWVHPFINSNCPSYKNISDMGYFVKDRNTGKSGFAPWWDGVLASIVDVLNEDALNWYKGRLQSIVNETGIDSFKFDAGETSWLPVFYNFNGSGNIHENTVPNAWSKVYADAVASFGGMVETRVGSQSYKNGIFVRVLDKDSNWSPRNGLQSLIPSMLVFGFMGYPFVLPDMVGGNAYHGFPDKQLFIRWMEANVFLPSIQFSIPPWFYDNETVTISQKMMNIRESYGDLMVSVCKESVEKGYPVIRPLWWLAPEDPTAQVVNDQYLLGDAIMVAPIVVENATSRDIYFPQGIWVDQLTEGVIFMGPMLYKNYTVNIDQLAYFINAESIALKKYGPH